MMPEYDEHYLTDFIRTIILAFVTFRRLSIVADENGAGSASAKPVHVIISAKPDCQWGGLIIELT